MTDFKEFIGKRRSIRDYDDRAVSTDTILDMIRESCFSPSSGNGQPWQFVVVNDKKMMKRISDDSKASLIRLIESNPEAPIKKYEDALRDPAFSVFYNAPCLVFIGGPENLPSLQVDCSLLAAYFMFNATGRGMGTCWIGLGGHFTDPELRRELGMPENYRIVAPVIVGYPKAIPEAAPRNEPAVLKVIG